MGDLSSHLAQARIYERLLAASESRDSRGMEPAERTQGNEINAHERQRARVWASLIVAKRRDRPTRRRGHRPEVGITCCITTAISVKP
jgi:hypothetical protein